MSPPRSSPQRCHPSTARLVGSLLTALILTACGAKTTEVASPVEVGVALAMPVSVALTEAYTGRAVASQSSEVRPQIGGVIQRRLFTEGSLVKAGQALYQIDPSLAHAAVNQAQADLESARAAQMAAQALAERYRPLVAMAVVSQQDYTNAQASARQATASVGQAQAALDTARINLRFTTVPSPINGRIGRALATPGALVTPNQADPLATIQQLDPIYLDIQQSAAQLTALRRAVADGHTQSTPAQVHVQLEDGSPYPHPGVVELSEVVVDPATGTVTLRVRLPNPDGLILPGMFLHASLAQAVNASAYLVPQEAVTRDARGRASVYVVDAQDRAIHRPITADRTQGAFWVVSAGLAPGERIIIRNASAVRPNMSVHAQIVQPVSAPARES